MDSIRPSLGMGDKACIHPTAIVADGVSLGRGVVIGPGCVIERGASIGDGCELVSYVIVHGGVRLGNNNRVGSFTTLGDHPQDTKHDLSRPGQLAIGNNNHIREYCSLHAGSSYSGEGITRVGDDNFIMCYCHLAHDCSIGNSNILANGIGLAGHVRIANNTVLGAHAKVTQFGRIGSGCMIGANAMVHACVPSYWLVAGTRARAYGINLVGMRRFGMQSDQIDNVRQAFRLFYQPGPLEKRRADILARCRQGPEIEELLLSLKDLPKGIVSLRRKG